LSIESRKKNKHGLLGNMLKRVKKHGLLLGGFLGGGGMENSVGYGGRKYGS